MRLLGTPTIEGDGRRTPPRGRKAWALLGYLLLAERPPGRRHLAELLFGDADDPLGALRWTLAELRRALGVPAVFRGDPVDISVDDALSADVRSISNRVPDRYQWASAYVLDAAVDTALGEGDHVRARRLVESLALLAARCDFRELVVRAHLHRTRLGESAALAAARLLARDIDNPGLDRLLDSASRG
ncbi:hypothetical protein [Plantactinospora sp. GCM10030261]|uniref:AfsR/SARP family transcriptional regulator n=1 Tax=Plantactinospora sp. GCM10030261 TaxID=3273420 RepID=UPI00361328C6